MTSLKLTCVIIENTLYITIMSLLPIFNVFKRDSLCLSGYFLNFQSIEEAKNLNIKDTDKTGSLL